MSWGGWVIWGSVGDEIWRMCMGGWVFGGSVWDGEWCVWRVIWRCGYGLNPDRAELLASNLPQSDILSKTRSSIMPYHNP